MSWTAPKTWSTNEFVTAALLNTHLRDNLLEVTRVYARATTTVDVTSTTAETTLFSQAITGNDMESDRALRLSVIGDFLYADGANDTLTYRVKFGGTTLFEAGSSANLANSTRVPWRLDLLIANKGAVNSQYFAASYLESAINATATTGIGQAGDWNNMTPRGSVFGSNGLSSIDTSLSQTLAVTAQWGTSSANLSLRMLYAVLELV